ncbi:MAG: hypothetical protein V4722_11165 [Bacteroidota bacterium]
MKKNFLLAAGFLLLFLDVAAQTNYYSKAASTDFTDINSWGSNTNGTGAAPASISNANNFIIQNGSVMNLNAGSATVRRLTINTGSLAVSGNTLTVTIAGQNNTELNVSTGGTLILNGGNIQVNGAVYFANGAGFTHSSGTMIVDANSGIAATSIAGASGTQVLFGFGYSASGGSSSISSAANALRFSLTGGTVRIIDPSFSSNPASYALASNSANFIHINAAAAHSFEFGDGVSTTAGGSTNGFGTNLNVGLGRLYAGSFLVNALTSGNRKISTVNYHGFAGNITINSGSEMQVTNQLYIAGNIVNDGTLTFIFSAEIHFESFANGVTGTVSTPQSVSGNGIFRNEIVSTANFGQMTINNSSPTGVTFASANSLLSGANTGTVEYSLAIVNGVITTTGANAFVLGTATNNVGSLSATAGGFAPGSTFGRWFGFESVGANISAGIEPPSAGNGFYPFLTGGSKCHFYIRRPVTTGATGGVIKVKYNHALALNQLGVPVPDGAYSITHQTSASWEVTTSHGFAAGSGTFIYAASGQSLFSVNNGNTRVMKAASVPGAHQNGTILPHGQRINIAAADHTGTFHLGINAADLPFSTARSGPWEDPNTWLAAIVPGCGVSIHILNGHAITVNGVAANVSNVTINSGGTLSVTGNTLTVGCVDNNNSLTNNGKLSVSGGTLLVNGNVNNPIGSTFSQTGGTIIVDGNKAGDISKSVATGTPLFLIGTSSTTLNGGVLIFRDPHAGASSSDDVLRYHSSISIAATTGHTLQLGDGISTEPGGNSTNGMSVELLSSFGRLMLGNLIVNTISTGTTGNRFVGHRNATVQILGNLTITSGRYAPRNISIAIAGNIINNGEMISTGSILFQSGTGASAFVASTNSQSISGTGIFANNPTIASATANFFSIVFNNRNATGITFNSLNTIPGNPVNTINVSNNLTFTKGKINIVSGTTLLMGTVAAGASGNLTVTEGGITPGSSYGRFWSAAQTGATNPGGPEKNMVDPNRTPFIDSKGVDRSLHTERELPTAPGITSAIYTHVATTADLLVTIPDGVYLIDYQYGSYWTINTLGTTPSAASFTVTISAPGSLVPIDGNGDTRIMYQNGVIGSSTHQSGNDMPTAIRTGLSLADLTAGSLYLGINSLHHKFTSKTSGPWDAASTWLKETVPTCSDEVIITGEDIVTINTQGNVCKRLEIQQGCEMEVTGGEVTVGCTNNNNALLNYGSIVISGDMGNPGIVNIQGFVTNHISGAVKMDIFGYVGIDGNDNGNAATSVPAGTALLTIEGTPENIHLNGGTIHVKDPPVGNDVKTFVIPHLLESSGTIIPDSTFVMLFGNGAATQAGSPQGFKIDIFLFDQAPAFEFSNIILDFNIPSLFFQSLGPMVVRNNITVKNGAHLKPGSSSTKVGGTLDAKPGSKVTIEGSLKVGTLQ